MLAKSLSQAAGNAAQTTYVDDVFSAWLYTGNDTTQTITNGIDLAGEGGMVWIKSRNDAIGHRLTNTTQGASFMQETNSTAAADTSGNFFSSFSSSGFAINDNSTGVNKNLSIYASWTFRNAPKFFTQLTVSHTNGTATNINLSSLKTLGMVVAKITNTTGDWITWHRSLTAGNNLRLNTTAAQTTTNAWLSVSGTTATLASAAPTGTYVIYAWAHDTASDGLIQCGSFVSNSSGVFNGVNLGWEPQFVITKNINSIGQNWAVSDNLRGMNLELSRNCATLIPNDSTAEAFEANVRPNSVGFDFDGVNLAATWVYLAIRMPNKPPTSGTEVFQPVVYTGTNADNRLVNTGMKTDMVMARVRSLSSTPGFVVGDRLRGQPYLGTATTNAELADSDALDLQIVSSTEYGTAFSSMTGFWVGNDATANLNANTTTNNHIVEAFRRAPGFFDIVCYTGTTTATSSVSRLIPHQLGVVPELTIIKGRSNTANHVVSVAAPSAQMLRLNGSNAATTSNNVTNLTLNGYTYLPACTSTQFAVRAGSAENVAAVDANSVTYVAYLFATLPGISKVGSYTGNGSTQTIDCGFTTGARFVLIKQTNVSNQWFVFDSARGISSGNDPWLQTDTTNAEGAADNILGTHSSGFSLVSALLNTNGATYIFLAIS